MAAEITHTPMVAPLLRLLSLTMIPFAISSVTSALFLRKIQYRTFAQSSGAITGIIMALLSVDRNDTVSRGSNFSPRDLARFNRGGVAVASKLVQWPRRRVLTLLGNNHDLFSCE
ncbi:hypothetical protein ACVWYH_000064 [Bradyrhizobium sp. GM24.11]